MYDCSGFISKFYYDLILKHIFVLEVHYKNGGFYNTKGQKKNQLSTVT